MTPCASCGKDLVLVGRVHKCVSIGRAVTKNVTDIPVLAHPVTEMVTNNPAVTGKRKRGRPRKPNALSGAERQRTYRARRRGAVS